MIAQTSRRKVNPRSDLKVGRGDEGRTQEKEENEGTRKVKGDGLEKF